MSEAIRLDDRNPGAALLRVVEFVCPRCGDERSGAHVDIGDGNTFVECAECSGTFDPEVLRVPVRRRLEHWRADAVVHADTALRSADGVHGCSYLALASCRRLGPELTPFGKVRLLEEVVRSVGNRLDDAQRSIAAELARALGLGSAATSAVLALH